LPAFCHKRNHLYALEGVKKRRANGNATASDPYK
jgi:hypothetical protein